MSILLTGGAGYIGSHTCIAFLEAGYPVVVADDFSNSKPEAMKRVEEIIGKKIPLYEIDVADKAALDDLFTKEDIEAVVHFAGFKAVGESCTLPLKYYRNNIDTTLTLLEMMKKHSVHTFVFSSSATVYGIPQKVPIDETMETGCTNPYGWTKLMIEQILKDAAAADDQLRVVLLRYFNPIGAHKSGRIGEDPNGIPNNLLPYISQIAVGKLKELQVFGDDYDTPDGTGVRDYIHVMDLAEGHVKAIAYAEKTTGTSIFNLGTGVGYSVLDIVKAFEKTNEIPIPYKITRRRPGDIAQCYADPARANRILGWKATRSLEDMCRDTWNWQKNNPNGYDK